MVLRIKSVLVLGFGIFAVACGSTVNDAAEAAGSGGAEVGGGGPGGGGVAGGGAGGGAAGPDLYACGIAQDCKQDFGHLGESITDEALRCGGELVVSGAPGALLVISTPGPYASEYQTLFVLLGDGTLLQQTRSRCMTEGACAEQNTTEWKLTPLEHCDVEIDAAAVAGCDVPDGECAWSGESSGCEAVPDGWGCPQL